MKTSSILKKLALLSVGVTISLSLQAQKSADTVKGKINSHTVVFITGAFVSHHGWDEWKTYFEKKGYKTIAAPWPHKDGKPSDLRAKHPNDTALAALTMKEVVEYYADIVKNCPEKPIIIGHSFGGLITQILVNRDLVAAGIAIHPAPTKGVLPYEYGFIRGGLPSLGLFTSKKKTYLMSFKKWQYAFTNGMTLEEQQKSYDENVIPESKTVARGGLSKTSKVDYKKEHPPLLITSGDKDHIIPSHLNKRNYKRYKQNASILEYKEFKGRNHFVLGEATWTEDADYILQWIDKYSAKTL